MSCNCKERPFRFCGPRLTTFVLAVVLGATAAIGTTASAEEPKDVPADKIDAAALETLVQSFKKVEKTNFDWGWIRWMMNSKLDPKAEMTFGVVQINAGQTNPLHVHPNCEEHLYVLSGSCEHIIGDTKVVLKKGDVIRIPRNVPHKATTSDKESMRAIIVYSSGDRQFVVIDEKGPKKPGTTE